MILIPRKLEGVETKIISTCRSPHFRRCACRPDWNLTAYSKAAGTTYITFDNVHVPVENLIGKEGEGFKMVLSK